MGPDFIFLAPEPKALFCVSQSLCLMRSERSTWPMGRWTGQSGLHFKAKKAYLPETGWLSQTVDQSGAPEAAGKLGTGLSMGFVPPRALRSVPKARA